MNKTLKIILIVAMIIIIVLTIVVLLIALLTGERKGTENANQNSNVAVTNETPNINTTVQDNSNIVLPEENKNTNQEPTNTTNTTETTGPSDLETALKTTASNFAERFGSYSNQSNFENITKLFIYMSENMQKWANRYIEEQKKTNPPEAEYYGITTKALKTTTLLLEEDKGTAEFTVTTQRKESSAKAEDTKIIYQDLIIKFIKEKGVWKVNEANWKSNE